MVVREKGFGRAAMPLAEPRAAKLALQLHPWSRDNAAGVYLLDSGGSHLDGPSAVLF
jgi:hypothetical protein